MLNVITLFSGYDSQCLALRRLGIDFDLVAWSEIDKAAIKAHDVLFPEFVGRNLGDVSKIDWSQIHEPIDLLTYSSPCQDFSQAGLQRGGEEGSGTRSSLLWEVGRAIDALHPRYLLLENVAALVGKKFLPLFGRWCRLLESKGYHNTWQVLNAKHYGVPQNRKRVFLVSKYHNGTPYYFPQPIKLEKRLRDVLEDNVDERYYLSEEKTKNVIISIFKQKADKVNEIGHCHTQSDWCGHARGDDRLIGVEGVSPTIMATTHHHPFKIAEPQSDRQTSKQYTLTDDGSIKATYRGKSCHPLNISEEQYISPDAISPCVLESREPKVIEGLTKERIEVLKSIERAPRCIEVANLNNGYDITDKVYSPEGISPTITTCQGGGREPKIAEQIVLPNKSIIANTEGFGTPYESKEVSPTVKASAWEYNNAVKEDYGLYVRIRRLTPRECLRLMDVEDCDIDKLIDAGITNTQLTKLAGNSIVVGVLYHIFRKLLVDVAPAGGEQMKLF